MTPVEPGEEYEEPTVPELEAYDPEDTSDNEVELCIVCFLNASNLNFVGSFLPRLCECMLVCRSLECRMKRMYLWRLE